jgi:hypothetical protein
VIAAPAAYLHLGCREIGAGANVPTLVLIEYRQGAPND